MTKSKTLDQFRAEKDELRRSWHRNSTSWNVWRTERGIWRKASAPIATRTASLFSTPFPLPTGAVPKRWNTGGRNGLKCATPSLRKRGLTLVSTTEAMTSGRGASSHCP